ncbi:MAG TPA: flavin monoamine oxidase family protein [Myxococcota bacterium]|nr:flavin monoamine oxidase family protein [Myxococcota bacterium]
MPQIDVDICVVGAGYAGLTAARRLTAAGRTAVVLEARDRVGGRVWTQRTAEGIPFDVGGTWLGPGQDAAYALAHEMGVGTYRTWTKGEHVLVTTRGVRRYRGLVPPINPIALAGLALGMAKLNAMARRVPLDEPWTASRAATWDAKTIGDWLGNVFHVPGKQARALLGASMRGLFTSDPSEVSLLHALYLIRSAGSLERLLSVEGGYQQDQLEGGAQEMANRMAADLREAIQTRCPVRDIVQDVRGVRVYGGDILVRARRALVTIPPTLAAHLRYDPPLPAERALFLQRMPSGSVVKIALIYDEPFWRSDGLCGESVALRSPIETTLDASPASGRPGVLAAFSFGPLARKFAALGSGERRHILIDTLVERFGARAAKPVHYHELDWAEEPWTRGCYLAHMPPGVLTQFGRNLREPVGRIHWAGTETATLSHGTIDGAIRSGNRAAAEMISAEAAVSSQFAG